MKLARYPGIAGIAGIAGIVITAGATALLGACGSGGTSGAGGSGGEGPASECFDYKDFKGSSPAVTFKADVMPILRKSCALGPNCHGAEAGMGPQHYLGPSQIDPDPTPAQLQAIFDQNVGKPSVYEPKMKIIAPSDPEHSFFMFKLDGVICDALACSASSMCGGAMPLGTLSLSSENRDTFRRWIAQGAKND